MQKKINFVFVLAIAFALFVCVSTVASATIYVPDDYAKIQWAIDNATDGETIVVNASGGPYYETVNVNKQLILRGVDAGSGKPVVDAGGSGSAITLSADGITLEGFNATNSGGWEVDEAGIKITSSNNMITDNNVRNNHGKGILLSDSSNNNITGNNVSNNTQVSPFGIPATITLQETMSATTTTPASALAILATITLQVIMSATI